MDSAISPSARRFTAPDLPFKWGRQGFDGGDEAWVACRGWSAGLV